MKKYRVDFKRGWIMIVYRMKRILVEQYCSCLTIRDRIFTTSS